MNPLRTESARRPYHFYEEEPEKSARDRKEDHFRLSELKHGAFGGEGEGARCQPTRKRFRYTQIQFGTEAAPFELQKMLPQSKRAPLLKGQRGMSIASVISLREQKICTVAKFGPNIGGPSGRLQTSAGHPIRGIAWTVVDF